MASGGNVHGAAPHGAPVDAGIDLVGLLDLVFRRKFLILGTAAAVVALMLGVLWMVGPRYQATARLLIDPRELRMVENDMVQRDIASDMVLVESQVEIITSEPVLRRVVERENLVADPDFYRPGTGAPSARTPQEIAIEALARAIKVSRPDNTYILEITVRGRQAAKAARLANAVAAAYSEDQTSSAAGSTLDLSSSISERLSELQARLREDEEKVAKFKEANGVSTPDGRLLLDTRLNDLSARLSAAVTESAQAKSRLDVMQNAMSQRGDVSSVLSESENTTMVGLRGALTDAQRRLSELQEILGPRHPRVGAAQAEVERARRDIRAESERLVAATRDAWRAAQETERSIAARLDTLTAESFQTNDRMIELRELERQAQASRLVYESYLVRARDTAELGSIGPRSARVIAPAAVPDAEAFPPRNLLAAASLVFGLGLGLFNAIVADTLQRRRHAMKFAADAQAAVPADATVGDDRVVLTFAAGDAGLAAGAALDLARGMAMDGWSTVLVDLADTGAAPGLAELSRGEVQAADILSRDPYSSVHMASAGDAAGGIEPGWLAETLAMFASTYDRMIVNAGALHGPAGEMTAAAIGLAEHALLVVPGATMSAREQQAYASLAASGVAVSVLSTAGDNSFANAA